MTGNSILGSKWFWIVAVLAIVFIVIWVMYGLTWAVVTFVAIGAITLFIVVESRTKHVRHTHRYIRYEEYKDEEEECDEEEDEEESEAERIRDLYIPKLPLDYYVPHVNRDLYVPRRKKRKR